MLIYTGYQTYQLSIIIPLFFHPLFGILLLVFGIVSLCTSLPVWQQKPWTTTIITGIGIAVCGALVLFGGFLLVFFFGPWYWAAIDYIRKSQRTGPTKSYNTHI
ncbi:MAG: hypothetical protein ACFFE3_12685 [Candidatus Thorarchaeota archaeon]